MKMKRWMALLLCAVLLVLAVPAAAVVPAVETGGADPNTEFLRQLGILTELEGEPGAAMTRAEFCVMVIRAMGREDEVSLHTARTIFRDVTAAHWARGHINLAASITVGGGATRLVAGVGTGQFKPDAPITYAQAVTILMRMLGYGDQQAGAIWPNGYLNLAASLGVTQGLALSAHMPITRAQAAMLMSNALKTTASGGEPYYMTLEGVAASRTVILLDTDAEGWLTVCTVTGQSASVENYPCGTAITSAYEGQLGTLLLRPDGGVAAFIPNGEEMTEIQVAAVKRSGITDANGVTHRIGGSAAVILENAVYAWNDTGYLRLNAHIGKTLRLYRDDQGAVAYVCLFAGGTSGQTNVVVAETVTAAGELARKLGITGSYAITKNGAPADAEALARYDVAYYDAASNTLRASDRQLTGYIEEAYPNLTEAETITVSGNKFVVLESAWESLADCALGDRVTLLLTDDGKAAMAVQDSEAAADMLGVLSADGTSVTLLGSGLTLKGMKIDAKETLRGGIVRVSVYRDEVCCSAYTFDAGGALDISTGTLGEYTLAPVCAVYEHTVSGSLQSHVYSLSGEEGKASYDFREIIWTDTIPANAVTTYHLNTAGQVDMILLRDVTGNCYEYGRAVKYTGENGIDLGVAGFSAYNSAAAVANADNGGEGVKRICNYYDAQTGVYLGVTAGTHNADYQRVVSLVVLKKAEKVGSEDFFLMDDVWYAVANAAEIPVSNRVQIYLERADRWVSDEEALRDALAMGQTMTLYYDRTVESGAQIRVIVVDK